MSEALRRRLDRLRRAATVLLVLAWLAFALAWLWPAEWSEAVPLLAWLSMIGAMLLHLFVPAGLLLAWLETSRLRWLGVLLAAFAAAPFVGQMRAALPASPQAPPLRVLSANLYNANSEPEAFIAELMAYDADVLLLQELTPEWEARLEKAFGSSHPHRALAPRFDPFGQGLYSRIPFAAPVTMQEAYKINGEPQMRFELEHQGQRVALYNVHLFPAIFPHFAVLNHAQAGALLQRINRETLPVIVAGDTNFSPFTQQGRQMHSAGFIDVNAACGTGPGFSWPQGGIYAPLPTARVDHIYLRGGVRCRSASVGAGAGSDHRPIFAELTLE